MMIVKQKPCFKIAFSNLLSCSFKLPTFQRFIDIDLEMPLFDFLLGPRRLWSSRPQPSSSNLDWLMHCASGNNAATWATKIVHVFRSLVFSVSHARGLSLLRYLPRNGRVYIDKREKSLLLGSAGHVYSVIPFWGTRRKIAMLTRLSTWGIDFSSLFPTILSTDEHRLLVSCVSHLGFPFLERPESCSKYPFFFSSFYYF
jgi:hypothetical protein